MPAKAGSGSWKENLLHFWDGEREQLDRRVILWIFIFALLIRIPLLIYPEVIHNDGTEYVRYARQMLSGDWSPGRAHPFYPFLMTLAHFVTPSDEIAGILVSVIFGALIVFPVFSLGKNMFNDRTGMIAAIFASVHPFLYTPSGSVLTESTFHFLFASAVLFGWKGFEGGRWKDLFLFALFTSLAYLTRPEAIAFLLVFGVWVLLISPSGEKRPWTKRISIVFLAAFFFLAFSSFYLIQLRKETGRWQISKKVAVSVDALSEDGQGTPAEMIRVRKKIDLPSLIREPMTVVKMTGLGLLESLYKLQQVYTPLLSILVILGFVLSKGKPFSQKVTYYLLSYLVLFFGFIHPFFWVTRRYTSHVISICMPWAAFGFVEVVHWIRHRFEGSKIHENLPAILLGVLVVLLFVQGRVAHPREHRVIQRELGYWMKDHLPKGTKIMSSLPQEAFYAELPWVKMPAGSYEKVLETARSNGVRYLVIDEMTEQDSPGFLGKLKNNDLIPLVDWRRKNQRMVVFEVVYAEGK